MRVLYLYYTFILQPQCEQYWPEDINAKKLYGPFDITLLSVDHYVNFRIRKLRLTNQVEIPTYRNINTL